MSSQHKGPVITKEKPELPTILKEDMLEKTMSQKEGEGQLFQKFKKEVMNNIKTNAGCIALAKRMCDDPGEFKPHVLCDGDLVRLDPEAFLRELEKVRNYEDYLKNLREIVKRSNYERVLGMFL